MLGNYDPYDTTCADLEGISVEMDRDGKVTISGVDHSILNSILTAAYLYRTDNDKFPKHIKEGDLEELSKRNARHDQNWSFIQKDVINKLLEKMSFAVSHTYGQSKNIELTRKIRKLSPTPAWTFEPEPVDPIADKMKVMRKLVREIENLSVKTGRMLDGADD